MGTLFTSKYLQGSHWQEASSLAARNVLLYLLNWERDLLARSLGCGKVGRAAVCGGAEGRRAEVAAVVLGKEEPLAGSKGGEGSALDAGTDGVAKKQKKVKRPVRERLSLPCQDSPLLAGECFCMYKKSSQHSSVQTISSFVLWNK